MNKKRVRTLLLHLVLLFGGFLAVMPFLWMITTSLKPPGKLFASPLLFPTFFHWQNYMNTWHAAPFLRFFLNSLVMAVGITIGQTLFSAMAGYVFARIKFPGRNLIFLVVISTLMIPFPVKLIPSFLIVDWLGWIDTYQALIVPRVVSAFAIFLFRQFFLSIPREVEEAAQIDGASRIMIFFRIMLPLSTPAIATSAIFSFLFAWNDFLWPLIVTNSTEMRTIQIGLAFFQGQYGTRWTYLAAGSVLTAVPAIIAFLVGQRRFIQGIVPGGIER